MHSYSLNLVAAAWLVASSWLGGVVLAELSLLGLGGGGGVGMIKGSSFGIDTSFSTSGSTAGVSNHRGAPKLSRVHGAGLIVDLDVLEVKACGGIIKYSPTQIEFQKGSMRWVQMMSEGKVSLNHNEKTVLQIGAPDASPYYTLGFTGNAAFRDLLLDQAMGVQAITDMCIASVEIDKLGSIASSSPTVVGGNAAAASVLAASANAKSAVECSRDGKAQHLSVQQLVDKLSRELLRLSQGSASALAALRRQSDNAMKPDMFVELRNNVITAQRLLMSNFTASEAALRTAVAKASAEMVAVASNLTEDTRAAVAELRVSTAEFVQTQLVAYVNATVMQLDSRTNRSIDDLRQFFGASVATVVKELDALALGVVPQLQNETSLALQALRDSVDTKILNKFLAVDRMLQGNMTGFAAFVQSVYHNLSAIVDQNVTALTQLIGLANTSAHEGIESATALWSAKLDELNLTMAKDRSMLQEELQNFSRGLSDTMSASLQAHNLSLRMLSSDLERFDAGQELRVAEASAALGLALNASVLDLRSQINETSQHANESLAYAVTAINTALNALNDSATDLWLNQSVSLAAAREEMLNNITLAERRLQEHLTELHSNYSVSIDALNNTQKLLAANLSSTFFLANAALNSSVHDMLANMSSSFNQSMLIAESDRLLLHATINSTREAFSLSDEMILTIIDRNVTQLRANISNLIDLLNATRSDLYSSLDTNASALMRMISDSTAVLQSNVSLVSDRLSDEVSALKSGIQIMEKNISGDLARLNVSMLHNFDSLNISLTKLIFGINESLSSTVDNANFHTDLRLEVTKNATNALVAQAFLNATRQLNSTADALTMYLVNVSQYLNASLQLLNSRSTNSSATLLDRIDALTISSNSSICNLNESISLVAKRSREDIEIVSNRTNALHSDLNSMLSERFQAIDAQFNATAENLTKVNELINATGVSVRTDVLERVTVLNASFFARVSELETLLNASDAAIVSGLQSVNASMDQQMATVNSTLNASIRDIVSAHFDLSTAVKLNWEDHAALSNRFNTIIEHAISNHSATRDLIFDAFSLIRNETFHRQAGEVSLQTNISNEMNLLRVQLLSNATTLKDEIETLALFGTTNFSSLNKSIAVLEANLSASIKDASALCNTGLSDLEQHVHNAIDDLRTAEVAPAVVRIGVAEHSLKDVRSEFSSLNVSVTTAMQFTIPQMFREMESNISHKMELHVADTNANISFLKRENELAVKIARAELTNEYSKHVANEIKELHSLIGAKLNDAFHVANSSAASVVMRADFLASDVIRVENGLSETKVTVSSLEKQTADLTAAFQVQSSELAKLGEMQLSSMTLIDSSIDSSKLMFESISARLDDSVRACGALHNHTIQSLETVLESTKETLSVKIATLQDHTNTGIENSERRIDKLESDSIARTSVLDSRVEDLAASASKDLNDVRMQVNLCKSNVDALNGAIDAQQQMNSELLRRLTESEDLIKKLSMQLQANDVLIARQQAQIDSLSQRVDAQSRDGASSAAVESLRSEFSQLQAAMLGHAGKVLDLVTANLATEKSKV